MSNWCLLQDAVMPAALLGAAATLLSAGNAQAAMEVANIAAGDGRGGILAGLVLPAVGWVLFNIAGGELLCFFRGVLHCTGARGARASAAVGLLSLCLLAWRCALLLTHRPHRALLFLCPAAGPAKNQIDAMGEGTAVAGSNKKRSIAAGLGLGAASLLATQNAEAAQQVADLAASDSRVGILAGLALPAIGWVLFNILGERCRWRIGLCSRHAFAAAAGDLAPPAGGRLNSTPLAALLQAPPRTRSTPWAAAPTLPASRATRRSAAWPRAWAWAPPACWPRRTPRQRSRWLTWRPVTTALASLPPLPCPPLAGCCSTSWVS